MAPHRGAPPVSGAGAFFMDSAERWARDRRSVRRDGAAQSGLAAAAADRSGEFRIVTAIQRASGGRNALCALVGDALQGREVGEVMPLQPAAALRQEHAVLLEDLQRAAHRLGRLPENGADLGQLQAADARALSAAQAQQQAGESHPRRQHPAGELGDPALGV